MDLPGPSSTTIIEYGTEGQTSVLYEDLVPFADNSSESCRSDNESFTSVQALFRLYLMPIVSLFGVVANLINIRVFAHSKMRNTPVNWFFIALSASDIVVLVTSFLVFQLPMFAETFENLGFYNSAQTLIVLFYPLATTSHTCSVVLTVVVSVHRYLGVCHPFLIRRISNATVIRVTIAVSVISSILFNAPKWFELKLVTCFHDMYKTQVLIVFPTEFMTDTYYTAVYRNFAYTTVMFIFPFAMLTFVNIKIVMTLRHSHRLRRQMTMPRAKAAENSGKLKRIFKRNLSISCEKGGEEFTANGGSSSPPSGPKKESSHGISVMLLAITCQFLAFNLLAFVHNIIELLASMDSDSGGNPTFTETLLTEMSTLMVNLNCASTILIYLKFGSKFRMVFLHLLSSCGVDLGGRPGSPGGGAIASGGGVSTAPINETTLLISQMNASSRRKAFNATGRSQSMQKYSNASSRPSISVHAPRAQRAMSSVPGLDPTVNPKIELTVPIRV